MKWSTDVPKVPGYYWIYTVPEYEDIPVVTCVQVCIINGIVSFDIPATGYEKEDDISPDRTTHWMGPIQEPSPPVL